MVDGIEHPVSMPIGKVLRSPSGTTRELMQYNPGDNPWEGELIFLTTKTYTGDALRGKFILNGAKLLEEADFSGLVTGDEIYHEDAGDNKFTILHVEEDGGQVTWVTMWHYESTPENTKFDFVKDINPTK